MYYSDAHRGLFLRPVLYAIILPMSQENSLAIPNMRKLIVLPLFSALIAAGAYIALPIGPVPLVLQNFFVVLSGLVLGPAPGAASVCLYILMGSIGLPVFAGGTGGIAHFAAPSAGYLVSYPAAAALAGIISARRRKKPHLAPYVKEAGAALAASFFILAAGVTWLKIRLGLDWYKALAVGFLPFIAGDIIKSLAAAVLAPRIRLIFRTEGLCAEK